MFIGIGAQKCASTWLHDILADHPEVCLPCGTKEVDFFSYRYTYGYQWYERQFKPTSSCKVIGEISPSYFHDIAAPQRVAEYNSSTRVIAFVRDPVERILSNHKHEVRVGRFRGPDLSLENGLRNNPSYVEQGKYATHLERWFEVLSREQFLLVTFDEVVVSPVDTARRVYDFLGIDPNHRSRAAYGKSNESYVSRLAWLDSCKNAIRSIAHGVGLGRIWTLFGNAGLRRIYRGLNQQSPDTIIPRIHSATIAELKATYSSEITQLEKIMGRSLDNWR